MNAVSPVLPRGHHLIGLKSLLSKTLFWPKGLGWNYLSKRRFRRKVLSFTIASLRVYRLTGLADFYVYPSDCGWRDA